MTSTLQPAVDVRRGAERSATRISWLDSKHSFSFGRHYDPANTGHGLLLVNNDDVVSAGSGFETHPHRDMEIVTWVLQGSLVHQDSTGHSGVIYPGLAQRMTAGAGSCTARRTTPGGSRPERAQEPVHFVQMWVVPDETGVVPGYEQLEVEDELLRGGLVPVASGHGAARRRADPDPQPVRRAARRPAAARSERAAARRPVPAPVRARGATSTSRAPGALGEGDAVRFTATGGQRVTATSPAEVLVWEMHAALG